MVQQEWFRAHIAIAKQAGKALMIHDRDAHAGRAGHPRGEGPPEQVIFHCFSGDAAMAKHCAEAGYVMSFAGNITFTNAGALREAAAVAPVELLLVETDAPFLTPVPYRGKPNSPAHGGAHGARAGRHQADRTSRSCARSSPRPASACSAPGSRAWPAAGLLGPAEIREIAGRLGVRPSKRLGQNFVVDPGRSGGSWRWRSWAPVTWCWRSARGSGR